MSPTKLEQLLAEIDSLNYSGLKDRYQNVFRHLAPPRLSQDLLRRALAHQVQTQLLGGLPPKIEKILLSDSSPRTLNGHRKLEPGSQLIREWRGEVHIVDVIESGYQWNGAVYTSLSAVAREITGTRWSGPRFFGLFGNGSQ